jgi:hypothetical protein
VEVVAEGVEEEVVVGVAEVAEVAPWWVSPWSAGP